MTKRWKVEFEIDGTWDSWSDTGWLKVMATESPEDIYNRDRIFVPRNATITEIRLPMKDGFYYILKKSNLGNLYRRIGGTWEYWNTSSQSWLVSGADESWFRENATWLGEGEDEDGE